MPIIAPTLFGLEIPDAGPIFYAALVAHIVAGLTCVVTGALAATAPKRPGRHPVAGTIYYRGSRSSSAPRPSWRRSAGPRTGISS